MNAEGTRGSDRATVEHGPSAAGRGNLKYQACNDRACFPPKSLPVEFQLAVEKPASAARR